MWCVLCECGMCAVYLWCVECVCVVCSQGTWHPGHAQLVLCHYALARPRVTADPVSFWVRVGIQAGLGAPWFSGSSSFLRGCSLDTEIGVSRLRVLRGALGPAGHIHPHRLACVGTPLPGHGASARLAMEIQVWGPEQRVWSFLEHSDQPPG